MIRHIVLFTPKPGLSDEIRGEFEALVNETLSASPYITRFSVGRRVDIDPGYSRSFGDKTYEFGAVLDFADRAQLVAYLRDDSHKRLGRAFWELCESCAVCEVETIASSDSL